MFLHSLLYIKKHLHYCCLSICFCPLLNLSGCRLARGGCSLTLGFCRSSLTLLCARYCMQGHHLAAVSSGQAASESTTSLFLENICPIYSILVLVWLLCVIIASCAMLCFARTKHCCFELNFLEQNWEYLNGHNSKGKTFLLSFECMICNRTCPLSTLSLPPTLNHALHQNLHCVNFQCGICLSL